MDSVIYGVSFFRVSKMIVINRTALRHLNDINKQENDRKWLGEWGND